jgi:uncharacterized protein YdeI (BOF family)
MPLASRSQVCQGRSAVFAQSAGGYTGGSNCGPGGFTGQWNVVSAEHAKTLKDDAKVTLQGTIQSHIGGDNSQALTWLVQ